MRLRATIYVEEDDIPEELAESGWPVEEWGAGGLGLLLADGDGGIATVESIERLPEEGLEEEKP